jgi:hypothetical protein
MYSFTAVNKYISLATGMLLISVGNVFIKFLNYKFTPENKKNTTSINRTFLETRGQEAINDSIAPGKSHSAEPMQDSSAGRKKTEGRLSCP